jgi:hypothetical protein
MIGIISVTVVFPLSSPPHGENFFSRPSFRGNRNNASSLSLAASARLRFSFRSVYNSNDKSVEFNLRASALIFVSVERNFRILSERNRAKAARSLGAETDASRPRRKFQLAPSAAFVILRICRVSNRLSRVLHRALCLCVSAEVHSASGRATGTNKGTKP